MRRQRTSGSLAGAGSQHPTIVMLVVGLLGLAVARPGGAQDEALRLRIGQDSRESVMVTVYNNNYGLVREVRRADLPVGTLELEVSDVAEQIDPTSVAFKSLTAPGAVGILEQNYRYDLLSPDTLLERFIGRPIRITTTRRSTEGDDVEIERAGTLLSLNGGRIVQFSDGEVAINPPGSISVAEVPDNLLARPTLVWLLGNRQGGEQRLEVSYLTNGMNWKADYVAVINAQDTALDLTGWVTLENHSGTAYADAQLKLIAGDVRRVEKRPKRRLHLAAMAMEEGAARQFEEKSFFEYHLYTLARRTTLANNETKQMTLLEGLDVPATKIYAVESPPWTVQADVRGAEKRDVQVMIEFENREENNLGMALPAGRVRVYKADTDQSLQLVGEDQLDHTPKNEKIGLILGNAFDIVAERSRSDYRKIADHVVEMGYKITIRNHKDEPVTVNVIEHVHGDWEIIKESIPHQKRDSRTIAFEVPVQSDGETILSYRVRVRW